jgi:hypothetical protein
LARCERNRLPSSPRPAWYGDEAEYGAERPPRPGAPVIRLRTWNLMGGATIYRVPSQARGLGLKEARRLARAVGRGELSAPG